MDAAHSHPSSPVTASITSPVASNGARRSPTSPSPVSSSYQTQRHPKEQTRQQRLLKNRNAKFPAKKLSVSGLSTKISQLIHANEDHHLNQSFKNKENIIPILDGDRLDGKVETFRPLAILEEFSNSARQKSLRSRNSVPIYQDSAKRPLLERSPFTSPPAYNDFSSSITSPVEFDPIQDSLSTMHLQEISANQRRYSLLDSSPTMSIKASRVRRIGQKSIFDAEEYIDLIERELQQLKADAYSPKTNQPLKVKLKSAIEENERLQKEVQTLRQRFETEFKNAVEHKTAVEVGLKRKIRELEDDLEQKEAFIQELHFRHEEKRLDVNIVDTLKATIERLEEEKHQMEDVNRSMTKRNEVLTELLAMSPTRTCPPTDLTSPDRIRRGGRPMSLVLPRQPSSPRQLHQAPSALTSPDCDATSYFSAVAESLSLYGRRGLQRNTLTLADMPSAEDESISNDSIPGSPHQLTLEPIQLPHPSYTSTGDFLGQSSPNERRREQPPRRKPRKFMSGSTQLKPLLLPTLAGDSATVSSPSSMSSPASLRSLNFSFAVPSSPTIISEDNEDMSIRRQMCHEAQDARSETSSMNNEGAPGPASLSATPPRICEENEKDMNEYETEPRLLRELQPSAMPVSLDVDNSASSVFEVRSAVASLEVQPWYTSIATQPLDHSQFQEVYSDPHQYSRDNFDHVRTPPARCGTRIVDTNICDRQLSAEIPKPLFSPYARHDSFLQDHRKGQISKDDVRVERTSRLQQRDLLTELSCEEYRTARTGFYSRPPHGVLDHPSDDGTARAKQHPSNPSPHKPQVHAHTRPKEYLIRTKSPLELLQHRPFDTRPLASLTIRTIYGTISKCTAYAREFRRDPLALARKVIANAWRSNWSRLGRLSWWVLGLFLQSPSKHAAQSSTSWDMYDGESIARRSCFPEEREQPSGHPQSRGCMSLVTNIDHVDCSRPLKGLTDSPQKPANTQETNNTSLGQRVLLWGKFSFAVLLAVGGAVVKGPAEMLKDTQESKSSTQQINRNAKSHSCTPSNNSGPPLLPESFCILSTSSCDCQRRFLSRRGRDIYADYIKSQCLVDHAIPQHGLVSQANGGEYPDIDVTVKPTKRARTYINDFFREQETFGPAHLSAEDLNSG